MRKLGSAGMAAVFVLVSQAAFAAEAQDKACAPGERLTRRDVRPDTRIAPGETLSDKLARTEGVLCPPHVDPEMAEKPAEGGALKVIPPPGTPEHKPQVRPK